MPKKNGQINWMDEIIAWEGLVTCPYCNEDQYFRLEYELYDEHECVVCGKEFMIKGDKQSLKKNSPHLFEKL